MATNNSLNSSNLGSILIPVDLSKTAIAAGSTSDALGTEIGKLFALISSGGVSVANGIILKYVYLQATSDLAGLGNATTLSVLLNNAEVGTNNFNVDVRGTATAVLTASSGGAVTRGTASLVNSTPTGGVSAPTGRQNVFISGGGITSAGVINDVSIRLAGSIATTTASATGNLSVVVVYERIV
jgi:hypothetical protein